MKALAASDARTPRSVAIFGGTFDPIHLGHLAVAKAARRRFRLEAIYFVPSSAPPHKKQEELAGFQHRYAMTALACAGHAAYVPSLAEAPPVNGEPRIFYSIDTVKRFQEEHPRERIYFIVGADSFLDVPKWKSSEELLDCCDFIVASRPGFPIEALYRAIPREVQQGASLRASLRGTRSIRLRKSTIHLLTAVSSEISSTEIRQRCKRGAPIHALVPAAVEDYILKQALYR